MSLEFNLVRNELPVTLTDPSGVKIECCLIQLDGHQRETYLDLIRERQLVDPNDPTKMLGLKSFRALNAELVSLCLFKKDVNNARTPFSIEDLQGFPATVIDGLYEAAREHNGMDKEAVKKAKNSSTAETNGSGSDSPTDSK